MSDVTTEKRSTLLTDGNTVNYLYHPSFESEPQTYLLELEKLAGTQLFSSSSHMTDDVTKQCSRLMHFAAFQMDQSQSESETRRWCDKYYKMRDLVVLGNQKLVFRAVQKQMAFTYRTDDMIGEGYLVMIRVVAAFNPWIGIRFSTYAFTCLMRAFHRMGQQYATDWLTTSLGIDTLEDASAGPDEEHQANPIHDKLAEYLHDSHPLLSDREKYIVIRRFSLASESDRHTLGEVGDDLGLSKERVRQLQNLALDKLRKAMA